jgi:nucleoside 2-deoxyribosyltransferase
MISVPINIYVASSWRNSLQPAVVAELRRLGHEVYDFRNPAPGRGGFAWSDIDENWQNWTPASYRHALGDPVAVEGYRYDIEALRACDACVMVLPCGRSANWEFGYAMGQGKRGVVVQFQACEPELMYREAEIVVCMDELTEAFRVTAPGPLLQAHNEDGPRQALGEGGEL